MPSNLNALLIAWALSLIIVVGGLLYLETSYTPMHAPAENTADTSEAETAPEALDNAKPEEAQLAQNNLENADNPATQIDTPIQAPIEDNSLKVEQPSLPAPGQPATSTDSNNIQPNAAGISAPAPAIVVEALPELLEETNQGFLPKVSADGRKPLRVYAAKPPTDATSPRIAIIMTNLGKLSRNTSRAIDQLPSEIGLAFSPYSANLNRWGTDARKKGFEVYLTVPMEPVNYPQNDPGPLSLLTARTTRENVNLLKSSLARFTGYVGVINHMGSRFTASTDSIRPILSELNRRGLMFIDSRSSQYSVAASMSRAIGMPTAINNRNLDETLSATEIESQLTELEKRAKAQGAALGRARPYPVTIRAINKWKETLADKGIILVPVSAIADLQPLPR